MISFDEVFDPHFSRNQPSYWDCLAVCWDIAGVTNGGTVEMTGNTMPVKSPYKLFIIELCHTDGIKLEPVLHVSFVLQ